MISTRPLFSARRCGATALDAVESKHVNISSASGYHTHFVLSLRAVPSSSSNCPISTNVYDTVEREERHPHAIGPQIVMSIIIIISVLGRSCAAAI